MHECYICKNQGFGSALIVCRSGSIKGLVPRNEFELILVTTQFFLFNDFSYIYNNIFIIIWKIVIFYQVVEKIWKLENVTLVIYATWICVMFSQNQYNAYFIGV